MLRRSLSLFTLALGHASTLVQHQVQVQTPSPFHLFILLRPPRFHSAARVATFDHLRLPTKNPPLHPRHLLAVARECRTRTLLSTRLYGTLSFRPRGTPSQVSPDVLFYGCACGVLWLYMCACVFVCVSLWNIFKSICLVLSLSVIESMISLSSPAHAPPPRSVAPQRSRSRALDYERESGQVAVWMRCMSGSKSVFACR